jgi:hypothetical protein
LIELKDGDKYKNKHYQRVLELKEDYDGRWYLYKRDKKGLTKTLSVTAEEMIKNLEKHYQKVWENPDFIRKLEEEQTMKMYAIVYKYDDIIYNFEKGSWEGGFINPSCLLPTRELAEQLIEDMFSDQEMVLEVDVLKVKDGELLLYEHDEWNN